MYSNVLFRVALVSLGALLSSACGSQEPIDSSKDAVECGGIAGVACPSGSTCEDDPNDGCDPQNGGADCGGVCVPTPIACGGFAGIACPEGLTCQDDPKDDCDPQNGGADCGGVCVPIACGGFGNLPCPEGLTCEDDPGDDCDAQNGDADCMGICVAKK